MLVTNMEKTEEPKQEKKKSVLEETREAIEELKREKEEISKIRDELNQLKSEQLLSGTAGPHIAPQKPKEETSGEYYKKVMSGGLNAKPTEEAE